MVAICHVGAGNRTLLLWKSSQCIYLLSHLSNLYVVVAFKQLLMCDMLTSLPDPGQKSEAIS